MTFSPVKKTALALMPISVEVFVSDGGVFLAAPTGCWLFDAPTLLLDRKARVLRVLGVGQGATARLPLAAVTALQGVSALPVATFALGGVVHAVVKPLQVVD